MILRDLRYAMTAGRPMLIDPLKADAFMKYANTLLSNPDIAYHISAWTDQYETKKTGMRKRNETKAAPWDDPSKEDIESLFCPCTEPSIEDGMGIIPMTGVIGKGLTKVERMLGCCDIKEVSATLDAWSKRDEIREVVFKVDSGGGSTSGLQEMAKKIRNYNKPTVAYCEDDCGSAAYWLASQCSRFIVTPSASIGAIGIYLVTKNESKKHKEDGVEYKIIKSGEYKAAGVENTALTALQEQRLQDEVIELHRRFIGDIKSVRYFANIEDMQGQSFYGDEALLKYLVTNLVDEWKEAKALIKEWRTATTVDNIASMGMARSIITTAYPTEGFIG